MKSGCCTPNVGKCDRLVRLVVGLALFSLFFTVEGGLKWLSLLSIPVLASAVLGWCCLYTVLKINTAKSCCGGGGCKTGDEITAEAPPKKEGGCGSGGCGCQ